MEHRLVQAIEKALDWSGPDSMGTAFARGSMDDHGLCSRLLTPSRLLDVIMRRSLEPPQLRVFRDGHELHPDNFLTTGVERRGKAVRMTDMRKLAGLLEAGSIVVLDALDLALRSGPCHQPQGRAVAYVGHQVPHGLCLL